NMHRVHGSPHHLSPRPPPSLRRLHEPKELPSNLSTLVHLGVHVDVRRVGADLCKDGGRNGDCAVDQEPAEVRVRGDSRWNVKVLNDSAANARASMVNVSQERAVDVRELDSIVDRIAIDRDCREALCRRRDRSRLVRSAAKRYIALLGRRYRGPPFVCTSFYWT